ncbi:MAG: hypothetical protein EAZ50_07600 [Runella slithyformis]|nr:MAG: hypothetical protein EAY79_07550 [Runella slithyformis]TAE98712.1 MAG: hypothetical protein EAZ80_06055 [Runella slithyformis]TAF80947.1 MAG: hypothetical protein EAZ50_07600 [Runella slithyformis]
MKIKTIRIKAEVDNQEFDFTQFFEGSNTIFTTSATLVKEEDGYYWHAFITFEPNSVFNTSRSTTPKKPMPPQAFEDEVITYTQQNPPKSIRLRSGVKSSIEAVFEMRELNDFHKLRNVGTNSVLGDTDYLSGILEIVKKHQPQQ